MKYDPERHHRRSIRLSGWDYASAGAYFVTICTHERLCLFGEVVDGQMRLNPWGEIVQEEWFRSADIRREIVLHRDEFVVMPNHVHGIIWITDHGGRGDPSGRPYAGRPHTGRYDDRPRGPASGSIGAIIAQYKSIVTKRINALRNAPGVPVWQRNYYEHIIRDERELGRIREYILNNPARWEIDENNPHLPSQQGAHRR
jgi:putative transposase